MFFYRCNYYSFDGKPSRNTGLAVLTNKIRHTVGSNEERIILLNLILISFIEIVKNLRYLISLWVLFVHSYACNGIFGAILSANVLRIQ